MGAHASDWNTEAHGICVMGAFNTILPNQAAQDTIRSLMECGISQVQGGPKKTIPKLTKMIDTNIFGTNFVMHNYL